MCGGDPAARRAPGRALALFIATLSLTTLGGPIGAAETAATKEPRAAAPATNPETTPSASDQVSSVGTAAAGTDEPAPAGVDAGAKAEPKGEDVFTPTESISEDFTVSFPVDI